MTDREMLELAAKIAGIDGHFSNGAPDATIFFNDQNLKGSWGVWNPLTNDGDAFRLSVDAGMDVCQFENSVSAMDDFHAWSEPIPCESERRRITRFAIVRAAAEIGKAMP